MWAECRRASSERWPNTSRTYSINSVINNNSKNNNNNHDCHEKKKSLATTTITSDVMRSSNDVLFHQCCRCGCGPLSTAIQFRNDYNYPFNYEPVQLQTQPICPQLLPLVECWQKRLGRWSGTRFKKKKHGKRNDINRIFKEKKNLFVCLFFFGRKNKKKRVIFEGKQKQICYLYPLNLKNK